MADSPKTLPLSSFERIAEASRNSQIITEAINKATRLALRQHKLAGNPVAVERDGKVVLIPASEIPDDVLE